MRTLVQYPPLILSCSRTGNPIVSSCPVLIFIKSLFKCCQTDTPQSPILSHNLSLSSQMLLGFFHYLILDWRIHQTSPINLRYWIVVANGLTCWQGSFPQQVLSASKETNAPLTRPLKRVRGVRQLGELSWKQAGWIFPICQAVMDISNKTDSNGYFHFTISQAVVINLPSLLSAFSHLGVDTNYNLKIIGCVLDYLIKRYSICYVHLHL